MKITRLNAILIIVVVILIIVTIILVRQNTSHTQEAPPGPPPIDTSDEFTLTKPMSIERTADYTYKITVEATDFCSAEVWWKKMADSTIFGSQVYDKFDKKTHTFTFTDFPKNDSIYVGAVLTQKYETSDTGWHPARVHTYQNGVRLYTNNFDIISVDPKPDDTGRIKVYATKKTKIYFNGGKTADDVTDNFSSADNPTEIEPGKWRHSALLPEDYKYWSAALIADDGTIQHTGIINIDQ